MTKTRSLRTCLVTGKKSASADFFRFVIQDGNLLFDTNKKNPGRGGYVLKTKEALEKLQKISGKIKHFLKSKKCDISDTVIRDQIEKL